MRFVHIADAHLDTSFAGRSETVRRRLRDASRLAFRHAVDLAIREDVQAFLIAGDLFDGARLSFQTERFLLEQAHRLADHSITVVYATGNHDPGNPDTGPRALQWPSNVLVADDATPQRLAIRDSSGRDVGVVTAVGHASGQETRDLSRLLPRPRGDLPEVALLHTQVHASLGSGEHQPYAPSELGYLTRSGYDYWALGHVHVRQLLSEDPPVAYPGSLQGKTRAETGPHGALLVDLTDRESPAISFRPLAPVRWETLPVSDIEDADSLDLLERRIEGAWSQFLSTQGTNSGGEWMVRVALDGACPLWRELQQEENRDLVAGELKELLGALDVDLLADGLHPPIDLDEHVGRTDVLGEALGLAEEVRMGKASLAIDPGELAGFTSGDPDAVQAYVRDLLDGADGEIAARMLGLARPDR
jgi:DNA repair exonuclease SbcCD nuclease subunit